MEEIEPHNRPAGRRWLPAAGLVGAGLIAGGILAGTLSAGAQTGSATPSTTAPAASARAGAGETALTGTTAEKVKAAALKAVPGGTIIRVETDSDGSPYEAHVRRTDGSEVVVKVDRNFAVTSVEAGHAGGHGPGAGETALTGTTADKVKTAALKAVPGGTIIRVETDSAGSPYEAHVRKTDGTEVVVKVDKSFNVTGIETHDGPHSSSGASA